MKHSSLQAAATARLIGMPSVISPELLYAMAKMGHGETMVLGDSNFPAE